VAVAAAIITITQRIGQPGRGRCRSAEESMMAVIHDTTLIERSPEVVWVVTISCRPRTGALSPSAGGNPEQWPEEEQVPRLPAPSGSLLAWALWLAAIGGEGASGEGERAWASCGT